MPHRLHAGSRGDVAAGRGAASGGTVPAATAGPAPLEGSVGTVAVTGVAGRADPAAADLSARGVGTDGVTSGRAGASAPVAFHSR